ncbi:MAG: amidohydrolase family protein [Pseudomonadota bacterium]
MRRTVLTTQGKSSGGAIVEIAGVAVPSTLLTRPEAFGGRPVGDCRVGTLLVSGGQVMGMRADPDAARMMVLPRLAEAHVHLDKCHTIDRLSDVGGDLAAAAEAQKADRALWTREDLTRRMRRGLEEAVRAGCGVVRTHIDWDMGVPLAWEVARVLASDTDGIVLQPAALTGIDRMADPATAEAVAREVARDGGVLGGFVLNHPLRREGIRNLFALADRFGLALDFHVDEGLEPDLDGLELIIESARVCGHEGPVLCGHACSLASRPDDDVACLADGLAETGIAVAALPTTNLYLQGRKSGTPVRRGLTRVHELMARGVDVIIGTDNVRDAFCPIGVHDPRHSLSVGVLAAHLDPPFADHLPMITTTARKALGLPVHTVDAAPLTDLICFDAPDTATLLSGAPAPQPLTDFMKGETCNG